MKKMSKKTTAKVKQWFEDNKGLAEKITDNKDELTGVLSSVNNMKVDTKGPIDGLMDSIKELYSLVVDWKNKEYTDVSKTTIVTIIIGFIYFASPVDIVPDGIPFAGLVDDFFVINLVLGQIESDLNRYRIWKSENAAEALA